MEKYDTTQLDKHFKRNKAQKKKYKQMLYELDLMFGENNAGLFIALVMDALNKMMREETPSEYLNLRTMEIVFNDVYSVKLDLEKMEVIKNGE